MQTFIINLESAQSRRQRIGNLLINTGIRFEFFPAVTPADEPLRFFTGFNNLTILLEALRRSVSLSEVACFASHLLLWQKCVELDQPITILEDDIEPTIQIQETYSVLEKLTSKYGFIRLDPLWPRPNYFRGGRISDPRTLLATQTGSVRLMHPTYVSLGAGAYAISPAAAKRMLNASVDRKFSCPVDNFFRRTWQHQQPMFYLEPAPFKLGSDSAESQISNRDIGRPDSKFSRKLRKLPIRLYQTWARYASKRESTRVRKLLRIDTMDSQTLNPDEPQGQLR